MINKEEIYKLIFYFVAAVTASLIKFIRILPIYFGDKNMFN